MKNLWKRKYSVAALASVMLVSQCCCCILPIRFRTETDQLLSRISAPAQAAYFETAGTQALCWDEKQVGYR
jgi:hypothetical protein